MRRVALLGLALMVGACSVRDPYVTSVNTTASGNWKIENTPDRITGTPTPSAQVSTLNASNSGDPKVRSAAIQLTCFEKMPIVRLSFEFKVGSDLNSILGYRFDDKPGHDSVPSRILLGYNVIVIEDKAEVARFVSELSSSKILAVRIRSLNAGRTTADFQIEGAQGAIDAVFINCPVTAEASRGAKS
jgi:hypothetical protein